LRKIPILLIIILPGEIVYCLRIIFIAYQLVGRYNCNRYDEEEAKKARDAQEVNIMMYFFM